MRHRRETRRKQRTNFDLKRGIHLYPSAQAETMLESHPLILKSRPVPRSNAGVQRLARARLARGASGGRVTVRCNALLDAAPRW